jgi:prolyl 4-hydroxylase
VEALNRRIASVTGTLAEQGEPLSVLRYRENQQFRLHHDCLPNERNQRVVTMIVFLTDRFEGGATHFPFLGLGIRGQIGDALFFANTHADGSVDQRSRHEGLPVTKGEKWICTRWIRADRFDPWGMR